MPRTPPQPDAPARHDALALPRSTARPALRPERDREARDAPARFVFERMLGKGAFGTVHKVYDKTLESSIAVKYLSAVDPAALFRFKSEFRTLVNLLHPNLVQHYELLAHDDEWLLTMEFVDGPDFLGHVRPYAKYGACDDMDGPTSIIVPPPDLPSDRPPPAVGTGGDRARSAIALDRGDEQRLRAAFRQLAEGLHALHREGRLHRDLKHENVLVSRADARVVICDFGFVMEAEVDALSARRRFDPGSELAGTLAFMSPEQASGQTLTPASDWYAAGVMLYHALTGQWPSNPRQPYQAAVQEKRCVPRAPREVAPGAARDLSELALALLHPEPAKRAGYAEIVERLDGERARALGRPHAGRPLLGRDPQLALLHEAFGASVAGSPALALVSGRSGVGKSALVAHFLAELEESSAALVLRARCYEREELPYKAIDPLIDALGSHLLRLAKPAAAGLLPRATPFLTHLFPALRRVPAVAEFASETAELADPRERKRLAFRAFREICRSLARERPLVLFVDDLQWGDLDSAPLFQDLLAPPSAPRVLIVCAYRDELAERIPLIKLLHDEHALDLSALHLTQVPLGPLPLPAATALALTLLQGPDEHRHAAAERIARESEGSPFFIRELAAYTETHGAKAARQVRLATLVAEQVQTLSPASRTLLSVVAVAGYPLGREFVRVAAGLGGKTIGALRDLELRRLLAVDRSGDEEHVECAHDRVRETVCRMLDAAQTRRIHRALGEALERAKSDDCDALLEHFRGADAPEKARAYALRGAQKAERTLAFARAADLYREALSLSARDAPDGRALRERLGKMLSFAGRGPEAAEVFLALVPGATHAEALHFRMLAATQFLRGGQLVEGFDELERADRLFGVRFPRSTLRAIGMLIVRKLRIRLCEHRLKLAPDARESPSRAARLDALWEVAAAVGCADFVRGNVYVAELSLRTMRTCDPTHVAGACGLEAIASAAANKPARVDRMLALAEAAAKSSGQLLVMGRVVGMAAVCRQLEGRWLESIALAHEAQALQLRSAYQGWDHAMMVWWEMMAVSPAGDLRELSTRVPDALRAAEARCDVYAATGFRTHRCSWAWLAKDRPDTAEFQVDTAEHAWKPTGYQFQHWHMTYARAEIDLYRGTSARTFERLMREWRRASLTRLVQNVRIDMLYTRARLAMARTLEDDRPPLRRIIVGDGRALLRERRPWATALGKLVLATAASLDAPGRALGLFAEAERALDEADMPLHREVARVRRGELMGGAEGAALLEQASLAITALGARRPEAFVRMLAPMKLASR